MAAAATIAPAAGTARRQGLAPLWGFGPSSPYTGEATALAVGPRGLRRDRLHPIRMIPRFAVLRLGNILVRGAISACGRPIANLVLELGKRANQIFDIGIKTGVGDLDPLPASEFVDACRQILALRQDRAVDQDGNHANAAIERGLDLNAHEVVRIVETAFLVRVGARQPSFSDDGDERVASADTLGKRVDEIEAGRDAVDIEKDVLASKAAGQTIVYPPGEAAGILSPIANEDAAKHAMPSRTKEISAKEARWQNPRSSQRKRGAVLRTSSGKRPLS